MGARASVDAKYYTVGEIIELMKVTEATILGAINSGELVAVNVSKKGNQGERPRWRVAEVELGRWSLLRQSPASVR